MSKLAMFFPGAGYGMDCPLLYYADFLFETRGYERLKLSYQDILLNKYHSLEEKLCQLRAYIRSQIELIEIKNYEEIVFIAKSIGCIEAGRIASEYISCSANKQSLKFSQIYLTPVSEALPFCSENCRVVIGTNDKSYSLFYEHCTKHPIPLLSITGGDHSLEISGNPYESIDVLKHVMEFI